MQEAGQARHVIEHLQALDRGSCSPGEREAAEWIAAEMRSLGASAEVQLERVHGTYWYPLGITSAAGVVAGLLARRRRLRQRLAGAAVGAVAAAAVVDDLSAGRRWLRGVLPKQTTANVLATIGDPAARRTLLVVSHHDAAHTGTFFDPRLADAIGQPFPPPRGAHPREWPTMAPIAVAPATCAAAAVLGARRVALLGAGVCAAILVSLVEVSRRPTVPGANDNLTGVAVLLGLARRLAQQPVPGLRVMLLSTGAEESLMAGMRAFAERHFPALDPEQTDVLCVDTVGSPHLVLPEAEGMLRVRPYDPGLKDLLASCAARDGIALYRGTRMRLGTDGYLALRHGLRAAMLMSLDDRGSPSNYHWHTDTAERVDYDRVLDTIGLCEAVARALPTAS